MPPEQPPYLVIADTSFAPEGLVARVEFVMPSTKRLRVRWGVGSPPEGYLARGGGVVFVADANSHPPPPEERRAIQFKDGSYVYHEGLGDADWLMLVMIFPPGRVLADPAAPTPHGYHLFHDRLAVYWLLTKDGVPESSTVRFQLHPGNVRENLLEGQPKGPLPFDSNETAPTFGAFVSYRPNDRWAAGRLTDRLVQSFGSNAVFRDIQSIPLGADFRDELDDAVGRCKVMMVVIGESWLDPANPEGQRRIDSEEDSVRIEIESALQRHRWIMPVLLDDTRMPREKMLPESLRELAFRQACTLRERSFEADIQPVIKALRDRIGG